VSEARAYQVWFRAEAPVEVALSAYGANDGLLEFLVGSGLWGVLTGMFPDGLRKGNGKRWAALNGVEVLRELARVDRIAHCGKIVRDVRLSWVSCWRPCSAASARCCGSFCAGSSGASTASTAASPSP